MNQRFPDRFGRGMDEDSWYSWAAVKLSTEAVLRGQAVREVKADGHKGELLQFRDGRLIQPLYVLMQRKNQEAKVLDV